MGQPGLGVGCVEPARARVGVVSGAGASSLHAGANPRAKREVEVGVVRSRRLSWRDLAEGGFGARSTGVGNGREIGLAVGPSVVKRAFEHRCSGPESHRHLQSSTPPATRPRLRVGPAPPTSRDTHPGSVASIKSTRDRVPMYTPGSDGRGPPQKPETRGPGLGLFHCSSSERLAAQRRTTIGRGLLPVGCSSSSLRRAWGGGTRLDVLYIIG